MDTTRVLDLLEAGNWQAAVAALNKGIQLPHEDLYSARLFLAMARWQLGEKELARGCHGETVAWIEKRHLRYADFRRLRAEAERLMGIEKTNDRSP